MPTEMRHFTDFAHGRGAGRLRAALRACIGPQNRQAMVRGEGRLRRRSMHDYFFDV
jgi:hypothetical protein